MVNEGAVQAVKNGVQAWREFVSRYAKSGQKTPLDVSGQSFEGIDDFVLNDVPLGTSFRNSVFTCKTLYVSATGLVIFDDSIFREHVDIALTGSTDAAFYFRRVRFENGVRFSVNNFALLTLEGAVVLEGFTAAPREPAEHQHWPYTNMKDATLGGFVLFRKCSFDRAQFPGVTFQGPCAFDACVFKRGADFSDTTFMDQVSFENCVFEASSSFHSTLFRKAPNFHNTSLHQGTGFSPAHKFPILFQDTASPGAAEAYRTLKLAMNRQHALSEEAAFFLLEMRSRARTEPLIRRTFYFLYDLLSTYGQSVRKPLIWLLGINVLFGLLYSWLADLGWGWWSWSPRLVSLTLHGAVPFVAALRSPDVTVPSGDTLFYGPALVVVQLALVAQGIASAALLFLIGLGLRNMFKIR